MAKNLVRITALVLFIAVVSLFFMYWLERLKIIPTSFVVPTVSRVLNIFGTRPAVRTQDVVRMGDDDDAFLLEKLRLQKQEEALVQQQADLDIRAGQITAQEQELQVQQQQISDLETGIDEREKSLNDLSKRFENKNAVLRYNVKALVSMPPQRAVEIISGYDDQTLIDTLVTADEVAAETNAQSIVPYWLSLMDAKRAADVQSKLLYRE